MTEQNKHIQGKDFEKWVEEKRSQFMALVDISKRAGETIPFKVFVEMVDAFIRQIAKELKPRVSRERIRAYKEQLPRDDTVFLRMFNFEEFLSFVGAEVEE